MRALPWALGILAACICALALSTPPGHAVFPSDVAATESDSGARAHILPRHIDWGRVPYGEQVRREFVVHNQGTAPLNLLDIKASCGCTAALPSKRRISPGTSASLQVSFDTRRKPSPNGSQHYSHTFKLYTNDPTQSDGGHGVVRVGFAGEVFTHFSLEPEGTVLLRKHLGSDQTFGPHKLRLYPTAGTQLDLAAIAVIDKPDFVTTGPLEVVSHNNREGVAVALAIAEHTPMGLYQGEIRLSTPLAEQPQLSIPVRAQIMPALRVHPPLLVVDDPSKAASGGYDIQVWSTNQKPLSKLSVTVAQNQGDDGVKLSADDPQPLDGGRRVRIPVRTNTASLAGTSRAGSLWVHTSDPSNPILEIPYLIASRSHTPQSDPGRPRITPSYVLMPNVVLGTTHKSILHLFGPTQPSAAFSPVVTRLEPSTAFKAQVTATVGNRLATIEVSTDKLPLGSHEGALWLRTTPEAKEHRVPIYCHVVSPAAIYPNALLFTRTHKTNTLVFYHRESKPLHVDKLTLRHPAHFTLSKRQLSPSRALITVARLQPTGLGAPAHSQLTITSTDPTLPPTQIPLFIEN